VATEKSASVFEVPSGASALPYAVVRVRDHRATSVEDQLAVEEPLEIRLSGKSLSITMRTPGEDDELVTGFLFSERIIERPDDLDIVARSPESNGEPSRGHVVDVRLKEPVRDLRRRLQRNFFSSSSCGLCGKVTIESLWNDLFPVHSDLVVPIEIFYALEPAFEARQATFEQTGGLHAAGLFDSDGRLLVLREDVGRHNAVDKVIGHMLLAGKWPLDRCILMVSGRASFEILQKAARARIPIVAAVSAPSSLAVQVASTCDMALVGFLRKHRLNIYAGSHRIIDDRQRKDARVGPS
jgi:FdhD protein